MQLNIMFRNDDTSLKKNNYNKMDSTRVIVQCPTVKSDGFTHDGT